MKPSCRGPATESTAGAISAACIFTLAAAMAYARGKAAQNGAPSYVFARDESWGTRYSCSRYAEPAEDSRLVAEVRP